VNNSIFLNFLELNLTSCRNHGGAGSRSCRCRYVCSLNGCWEWRDLFQCTNNCLTVIASGLHGLAMAKTYLEVNPSADVIILEAASTVGGVWAAHRLYPGLKSNNLLGTYEFSDFPMDPKLFDVKPGQHISGHVMHEYLTSYAEHFDLVRRVRFDTKVESAGHKEGGGWFIRASMRSRDSKVSKSGSVHAKKLVVATGMTSEAFLPTFKGGERFHAPLFHCRDFLDYESTLETAKSVVVFGGTKSAWDAVYAYASKGVKVNWVIRGMHLEPLCWNKVLI
jgi:cation diffusion facilitator CzcD-associated flavoprotein CzcO